MVLKSKKLLLCLLIIMMMAVAVGCGDAQETTAPEGAATEWPKNLVLGSASIGGTYFVYGSGIANVIETKVGIPVGVEVTGGPNHNIQLVEIGDLDLGMVTMGPAWEAWHGKEDWTGGVKHQNMRAIFPMYQTYSQWWAEANSGINSIEDLSGKSVGVGPAGGTAGTFHPRFLELLGVEPSKQVHAGLSDAVSQQLDRLLDANSFAAGVPVGGVLEFAAQRDIQMFGIDGAARDKILTEWPFWSAAVIPAEKYDFLEQDLETVAIWNVAIACKDLPEDLVYEIVKAVMENNEMMLTAHKAAEETLVANYDANNFLYWHPGAIRYFEEIGKDIDAALYPPEYQQ
ncbi:MAG: TAXI family TRAP transporter solute-binding subunit [Desulfotomaculum sp.]|nr:TAXI family TRAP transporter solute-binding subunit [Desulfotomaculum sp.]MCL0080790.1 TAXI family TRAP transporter solute-binding subunit [Peptococcaceae bacterium]